MTGGARCCCGRRWCNGDGGQNTGPVVVQELMAGQLAASLFGWTGLTGSGLSDDEQQMMDDADRDAVKQLEERYVKQTPGALSLGMQLRCAVLDMATSQKLFTTIGECSCRELGMGSVASYDSSSIALMCTFCCRRTRQEQPPQHHSRGIHCVPGGAERAPGRRRSLHVAVLPRPPAPAAGMA